VTWQLSSFLILAIGLVGGFAWYERSRPDAKLVALVAALAAFGSLGRIAFAALPNVKPTTDIVLIAGFALGAAPGYVVGALAALTSNFFFGQGPWTPWQMAGWGLVGIIGALLARAGGRRLGRLPLAVICFVVGFGFTALQDCGDWVNYSDHSLAQLGLYVGQGVGFDLVHATGCFVFAIAFGPALIRALQRFRRRLQINWHPAGTTAALLLAGVAVCGLATPGSARAAAGGSARLPASTTLTSRVGTYLLRAENRDGGVGLAPGQPSSTMVSGWQALALVASGIDPAQAGRRGGRNVVQYLAATAASETDPGSLERTILAVSASGRSVTGFGGRNLLAALRRDIKANGSVAGQTNLTAFAVLALRAVHTLVPARTIAWLARQQDRDGGFNFATAPGNSDADDTGAALEALAGTGRKRTIARAVAFLRGQQNGDGGFGDAQGAASNAQSTAFAVQGLIAVGVDPDGLRRRGARSPLAYLRGLIGPSGAVDYARDNAQTPVWVTAQALLALAHRALPL
jgi:energy-coupling factor transport system substrate-specific component